MHSSFASKQLRHPRRYPSASILFVLLVGCAFALRADESPLVRSLAEPSGAPLFVPAALAGRADGSIDWQLLGLGAKQIYRSVAEAPRLPAPVIRPGEPVLLGAPDPYYSRPISTCLYYAPGSFEDSGRGPAKTLLDAASGSSGIYQGRVVAITEGFFGGDIGSLIDLEIQQTLKPFAEVAQGRRLRLYYPVAAFRIGSTGFCKADLDYPPRPEIGDDMLLFVRQPPLDEGRQILMPEEDGVFVQKPGKLFAPRALRKDPGLGLLEDMSQLAAVVAAHLNGSTQVVQ